MDKAVMVYIHNGILLNHKNGKTCHMQQQGWTLRALCSVKLIKWRKANYDFTNMWNLNTKTKTNSQKQNRLVVTRGEGCCGAE